MKSFEDLAREYLHSFQEACERAWVDGTTSTEMATRPIVHAFLLELANRASMGRVYVHHDTNVSGTRSTPDWRYYQRKSDALYTFGDQKGLDPRKSFLELSEAESTQMDRYLQMSGRLFVFDGIRMLIFSEASVEPTKVSLLLEAPTREASWSTMTLNAHFQNAFAELFGNPIVQRRAELELIDQVALRARGFRVLIDDALETNYPESRDSQADELVASLHDLRDTLSSHHDPSLREAKTCADFVAQVVCFGLLYMHSFMEEGDETPQQRFQDLTEFSLLHEVDQAHLLRPFRQVISALGPAFKGDSEIAHWFLEICQFFSYAGYLREEEAPDYHTLFERFLATFDRTVRYDRGAFYTPAVLSRWLIRATDQVHRQYLGTSLAELPAKIIDPCCGTGSFLEEAIKILGSEAKPETRLVGFEVLPAPYALAQYRLHESVVSNGFPGSTNILLTDTLSDSVVDPPKVPSNGFEEEIVEVASLASPPVTVVVGNPPSTQASPGHHRTVIDGLFNDFRPPTELRVSRSNLQKALNNEAYRFLRWAANEVIASESGVLSLVLPSSLLDTATTRWIRRWLMEKFKSIYVLNFDADLRAGEGTGNSIFDVQQGRCLIIAVHHGGARPVAKSGAYADVYFQSVSMLSLAAKVSHFTKEWDPSEFTKLAVSAPNWDWAETHEVNDSWDMYWPMHMANGKPGIFQSNCSGVKNGFNAPLVHTDLAKFKERNRKIVRLAADGPQEIVRSWFLGQARKVDPTRFRYDFIEALNLKGQDSASFARYSYRPFVMAWTLTDSSIRKVIKRISTGARLRPEIEAAFDQGGIGIALAPAPKDVSQSLGRIASFVWALPDNDLARRGSARIYCDVFPELKGGKKNWNSKVLNNIAPEVLARFENARGAVFYVYAILTSTAYLQGNESRLYAKGDVDSSPRIPLIANAETRNMLVSLGREIADCENFDDDMPNLGFDPAWGVDSPEKLETFGIDAAEKTINLRFFGGRRVALAGVPEGLLELDISGYSPVKSWLRERTYAYSRKEFGSPDIEELKRLVGRLLRQSELVVQVDEILEYLTEDDLILPGHAAATTA